MNLSKNIEAVLFISGGPVSISRLSAIFKKTDEEIKKALNDLEISLENRGIRLVTNQNNVMLGTSADTSEYCEELIKEELNKTIGKAGLETLSIVLYKENATRAEIDYIRGVNSTFTLRNLSIRGLVERKINPKDKRSFVYSPSFELLRYLGINKNSELPNFLEFKNQLDASLKETENEKSTDNN